jgi:hypothetical protein
MPILNLAEEIARYMPQHGGQTEAAAGGGLAGGLVGGVFNALTKG